MVSDQHTCECGYRQLGVLALDGGGMRGYASLIFLHRLMLECANFERRTFGEDAGSLLPCHYFDYIAGTSTGGLIAIMLGRLRMTVGAATQAYEEFGGRVFARKRRMGLAWNRYDAGELEQAVKDVVRRHCPDQTRHLDGNALLRDPEESDDQAKNGPRCRTICYAIREKRSDSSDEPYLFRSYWHPPSDPVQQSLEQAVSERNTEDQQNFRIWEAARATTAAPTYFLPFVHEGRRYVDGGFGVNNPSRETLQEVRALHRAQCTQDCRISDGQQHHDHCTLASGGIGVMVSVGTGRRAPRTLFSKGNWVRQTVTMFKKAKREMTDTEDIHRWTRDYARESSIDYYRLNVEDGLQDFKLDACEIRKTQHGPHNVTLSEIRRRTEQYIENNPSVQQSLRKCAERLVDMRRSRGLYDAGPASPTSPGNGHMGRSRSMGNVSMLRAANGRPAQVGAPRRNLTYRQDLPEEQQADFRPRPLAHASTFPQAQAAQRAEGGLEPLMSPTASGPVPVELPHEREPQEADEGVRRVKYR